MYSPVLILSFEANKAALPVQESRSLIVISKRSEIFRLVYWD
jgi:hypothetical protein